MNAIRITLPLPYLVNLITVLVLRYFSFLISVYLEVACSNTNEVYSYI